MSQLTICSCGQAISPTLFDGRPRTRCPYCRRTLGAAESGESAPSSASSGQTAVSVGAPVGESASDSPQQGQRVLQPNIYRDGKWIVAPLEGAVFPKRCVKTNLLVEGPRYHLEADLLRSQIQTPRSLDETAVNVLTQALFGTAGGALADLARKRRLIYRISLCENEQDRSVQRRRYGLALVVAGPILGFVLAMATVFLAEQMGRQPSFGVALVGIGIGMAVMAAGVVLFGLSTHSVLRVRRSNGAYVWLEGAHPQYLASLPVFPEPQPAARSK
jgi:hypothetical protein